MSRTRSVHTPVAHLVGPGKLKVVNGHLAFTADGQSSIRLDPKALRTLFCYGGISMTDAALQLLFEHDIEVALLTPSGTRCRGRLVRSDTPGTTLRMIQHECFAQPERRRDWAREIVAGKIASQIAAARHHQRHGVARAGAVIEALERATESCARAETADQLRGVEGAASAAWFELYAELFREPWHFPGRVRRPPTDPINALLSLGYTWLTTRTGARIEALGLEVNLGALHEYRPGRPSLACDMIEPLRIPGVDRWVLAVCQQGIVTPSDFQKKEEGIVLQSKAFGRTLHHWEQHWQGEPIKLMETWLDRCIARLRSWSSEVGE